MSLLIVPPARSSLRRLAVPLAEELHFDPRAVRRAVAAALERDATRAPSRALLVRSELTGLKVGDVRRAPSGLPPPGDYRGVVKPPRDRTRPPLAGPCGFDGGRIILHVPEPLPPLTARG